MRIVMASLWVVAASCTCGSKKQEAKPEVKPDAKLDSKPPTPERAAEPQAAPPLQVNGFYKGDWGQMVLREKDGRYLAVYGHDKGTVVGSLVGDTLIGWWCETPSRKPDKDAGEVELKFTMDAAGPRIDGRWRYGATGKWRDDWDLAIVGDEPSAELVARFDDAAAFCMHP